MKTYGCAGFRTMFAGITRKFAHSHAQCFAEYRETIFVGFPFLSYFSFFCF